MEAIHLKGVNGPDHTVRLEVPCSLPPGPVQVVVVVAPLPQQAQEVRWSDISGLGKEIWAGIDAQDYVNQLRDEWER